MRTVLLASILASCSGKDESTPATPDPPDGTGSPATTDTPPDTGPPPDTETTPTGDTGPTGTTTTGSFRLEDPLRDGTVGLAVGGSFGPDGWTVTGNADRIIWELPRLAEGSAEFTMSGVTMGNLPLRDHEVFGMYDGGHGMVEPIGYNPEYRDNHYKVMIRIYGQQETGREGQQKIMWKMCPSGDPGYGVCGCPEFFEEPFGGDATWDGSPQRMRVEWGQGVTRYLRDGVEVLAIDWSGSGLSFGPEELHLSLGTPRPEEVGDASMPLGAVFSDLVVEGIEGDQATCP